MNDDARLIDATRQGDSAAFGELVERYQRRLLTTMLHVTGSREEAEDVVQDAFIQSFVKLDSFRGHSSFYTWLYRIAFNVSVSRRRRKRVEVSVEQSRELAGSEPVDEGEAPSDQVLRQERAEQLHDAMGALTEEHRAILVLREMNGCCYDTIGEILDLPVGTVRSRLHRARMQLRQQLKELVQGNPIE